MYKSLRSQSQWDDHLPSRKAWKLPNHHVSDTLQRHTYKHSAAEENRFHESFVHGYGRVETEIECHTILNTTIGNE